MRWITRRWNVAGAVLAVLLLAGVLVVTALDTPGYRAAELDLNDASVWIGGTGVEVGDDTKVLIGRANLETPELEAHADADGLSAILQDGDDVLIVAGSLHRIAPGTDKRGEGGHLPESARVALGGGTAAVLDATTGKVWTGTPEKMAEREADGPPSLELGEGETDALLVVGALGTTFAYAPGSDSVRTITAAGSKADVALSAPVGTPGPIDGASVDSATASTDVQLSAVGDTPIVLDADAGEVTIGDRSAITLPEEMARPELQQPGPARGTVVISSASGLWEVPLAGGSPRRVTSPRETLTVLDARSSLRPVVDGACYHGAFLLDAQFELQRVCPGRSSSDAKNTTPYGAELRKDGELVLRGNKGRAVANEVTVGWGWTLDIEGEIKTISNWDQTDEDDEPEPNEDPEYEPQEDEDCSEHADVALEIEDQKMGARATVPTLLRVFDDDTKITSANCAVLAVEKVEAPEGATVDVVGSGDTIQFLAKAEGDYRVELEVSDGRNPGRATAVVNVKVHPFSENGNQDPDTGKPRATSVVAGRSVSYNVLSGVTDPEGDLLTLTEACIGSNCSGRQRSEQDSKVGTIQFQADGWVRIHANEDAAGNHAIEYTVVDQWGGSKDGKVSLKVVGEDDALARPVAHPDAIRVVKGRSGKIDPAANDVSPRGAKLSVGKLTTLESSSGEDLEPTRVRNTNELEFTANDTGTFLLQYELQESDPQRSTEVGSEPARGLIRVDVVEEDLDAAPIAVVDEAILHGEPLLVDVTRNDIDRGGKVLVVRRLDSEAPEAEGIKAQLLSDRTTVRITATEDLESGPKLVPYKVSNGSGGDDSGRNDPTGYIVVRSNPSTAAQAPFPQDDGPISVKAGGLVSIPVVDNDISPQGGPLRVTKVESPEEGKGEAFVGANEVRYVAPDDAENMDVTFRYYVEDEGGRQGEAKVTVQVEKKGEEDENRPPEALALEARTVFGQPARISVPLLSADPDGDIVSIAGLASQPAAGTVEILESGLEYKPSEDKKAATGTFDFEFWLTDGDSYVKSTARVGVIHPYPEPVGPVAIQVPVKLGEGETRAIPVLDEEYVVAPAGGLELVVDEDRSPTDPKRGKIEVSDDERTIIYTAPGDIGSPEFIKDAFTYKVRDGRGEEATNSVDITITKEEVAVAPLAGDDILKPVTPGDKIPGDGAEAYSVLENDVDPRTGTNEGLRATYEEGSGKPEALKFKGGIMTYEMTRESVRFRYELSAKDNDLTSQGLVVIPANLLVRCKPMDFDVKAGGKATVEPECTAPPGDEILFHSSKSTVGTVSALPEGGGFVFEPSAGLPKGTYPVSYEVCVNNPDGSSGAPRCKGEKLAYHALAKIGGKNDPPELDSNLVLKVPAGSTRSYNLKRDFVYDPNQDDVTFTQFKGERVGSGKVKATLTRAGELTLVADSDAYENGSGGGDLQIQFSDGEPGGEVEDTIKIEVTSTEDGDPIALDDVAEVKIGDNSTYEIDVRGNDDDPAGNLDALEVSISQPPRGLGTVQPIGSGKVRFTPSSTSGGETSFRYTLKDPSDTNRTASAAVKVKVIGKPTAPGTPQAEGKQDGQIPLTWGPADGNGGSELTYTVECEAVAGGRPCPSRTMAADGTNLTVTDLSNGSSYRFRVRAENEAGEGPPSAWSLAASPDVVPEITGLVATIPTGDYEEGGKLIISWTASSEGSDISRYEVRVGGQTFPYGPEVGPSASVPIDGLQNGVRYPIQVRAENGGGWSEWASTEAIPKGVPGAPGTPTAQVQDGDVVDLRWAPADGRGDPGLFYEVELVGGAKFQETAHTSISLSNQEGARELRYRVRARNSVGWGDWSEPSTAVINVKPPDPPTAEIVQSADPSTIELRITDPGFTGGAEITGYEVAVNSPNYVFYVKNTSGMLKIGGQSDGVKVDNVKVKACNSGGKCGDPSEATGSATPIAKPTKVEIGVGTWDGDSVTWTWTDSASAGATITYEIYIDGESQEDISGTSYTFVFGCDVTTATITVVPIATISGKSRWGEGVAEASNTREPTCEPDPEE